MNDFAALFHRDYRPVGLPDATNISHDGRTPLVQSTFPSVYFGLFAHQIYDPLVAGHPLYIVADARLDNRAELISRLHAHYDTPDAILIAHAYNKWGTQCPRYLLGDFAFLIWDQNHHRMFAARDHLGVRPLYYHVSTQTCIAASTIHAVRSAVLDKTLNPEAMADFVAGSIIDDTSTAYQSINRLAPGHWLVVDPKAHRIERYWRLDPSLVYDRNDVVEAFSHHFSEAVRVRFAAETPTGIMLSGGLDSSAITAVATHLNAATNGTTRTFSVTFTNRPDWNEQQYIEAVLARGRFAPIYIPADDLDPFSEIDAMLAEQGNLFLAYNLGVSRKLYQSGRANGITTLLDGHGGDEVVSQGLGRLNELAHEGRWINLWRESRGIAAIYGTSALKIAQPYALHNRLFRSARWRWNGLKGRIQRQVAKKANGPLLPHFVSDALAHSTRLDERHAAARFTATLQTTERQIHINNLEAPSQSHAFEVLDRAARTEGIMPSYPFYDRRLVEFCVSLAAHEKLDGGFPRLVLRRAMKGMLPDSVRLRRDKYDFRPQFAQGIAGSCAAIQSVIDDQAKTLAPFLNVDVARTALENIRTAGSSAAIGDLAPIWRMVVLSRWLKTQSVLT
jgi:asparagine synthase (glutamine-hydrolysing)